MVSKPLNGCHIQSCCLSHGPTTGVNGSDLSKRGLLQTAPLKGELGKKQDFPACLKPQSGAVRVNPAHPPLQAVLLPWFLSPRCWLLPVCFSMLLFQNLAAFIISPNPQPEHPEPWQPVATMLVPVLSHHFSLSLWSPLLHLERANSFSLPSLTITFGYLRREVFPPCVPVIPVAPSPHSGSGSGGCILGIAPCEALDVHFLKSCLQMAMRGVSYSPAVRNPWHREVHKEREIPFKGVYLSLSEPTFASVENKGRFVLAYVNIDNL